MLEAGKREWALELQKFTPVQVWNGFEKCKRHHTEEAPNLMQFISCVKEAIVSNVAPVAARITTQETDEAKEKRIERGDKALTKLKAIANTGYSSKPRKKDYTVSKEKARQEKELLDALPKAEI